MEDEALKEELRAKYQELLGKKPHHKLSIQSLQEAIENEENQISTGTKDAGQPGSETGTESGREVKELAPDEVIEREIRASRKVKDGKRHLVYKDGQEVWWTDSVIRVMLKSFPDRITFPEGTEYIAPNIKTCSDCG